MSVEAAFPSPPPYYKRYAAWTEESADNALKPPLPLPFDEPLMIFGALAFPPLNEVNNPHLNAEPKPQLYPKEKSIDPVSELKKLNKALLFNFLELLEVLIKNPALYQKKVDDLEVIFVNMHHLLNSFRPHQARSYIISVMEEQVTKKKQAVETLRSVFANVELTMKQLSEQVEKEAVAPTLNHVSSHAMEVVDTQPAAAKTVPARTEANPAASFEMALAALKEQLDKLPVGAVPTQAATVQPVGDDDDEVKVTIKVQPKSKR